MSFKTPFLKHILLPVTSLLLVVVCFFGHLTDIAIIDLTSGFSHPIEGWDHLITMLAVGIWAAQLRGKAIWLLPLTFVSVMSLGGVSGAARYLAVPSAEVLILLSCVVFSILIIRKIRFDTKINVLIVAFFAFFHGYAHGQEISASASLISYTIGFMIATLLLHGAGILVAKLLLISVTIFIAQTLHAAPMESDKSVTIDISITHTATFEQYENQQTVVEKPPLIHCLQWRNLSPSFDYILHFYELPPKSWLAFDAIKTGIQHLKNGVGLTSPPACAYFFFALLHVVFIVTQFFCYVFYPKQHRDSASFLTNHSEKSFHVLTLSRLFIFNFHTRTLPFLIWWSNFVRPKFTEIFMSIYLSKNGRQLFSLSTLLFPSISHAHSMVITPLSDFNHPLHGIDHLVVMLVVIFWVAKLRSQAIWLLPVTFVSVTGLSGFFDTVNVYLSYTEWIILLSGIILSVQVIRTIVANCAEIIANFLTQILNYF